MNLATNSRNAQTDAKGLLIVARSLYRDMRDQGYAPSQIIELSSELLQLVHDELHKEVPTAAQ